MWIKRNIVMLPSKNGNSKIGLNPNALFNKPHLYYFNGGAVYHECQHFYITSDMEIKEGEWCFEVHNGPSLAPKNTPKFTDEHGNTWWLRKINMNCSANDPQAKKIIATTDTSLNLPQIPQQFIEKFIEKYNKGNIITEVEVEYLLFLEPGNTLNDRKYDKTILKVNPNSTINIKSAKDSWTRDEVIEILNKFAYDNAGDGMLTTSKLEVNEFWIEENL